MVYAICNICSDSTIIERYMFLMFRYILHSSSFEFSSFVYTIILNTVNPPAIPTDATKAFVCYFWHTCIRRLTRPPIFTRVVRIEIHDYCNHGLFPELVCEDWR